MPTVPIQKNDAYILAVQQALFSFQMIEESLKLCIRGSYEIIQFVAPSPVAFNFELSAIEKAPLGRLIAWFGQVSSDKSLISDLKKIEKWRNFCAHRAYIHEFMSRQSGDAVTAKDVEDVQTIIAFSVKLVERLTEALRALQKIHKECKLAV